VSPDLPLGPISDLAQAATQLHELFSAYVAAGFTEPQALYLIGQLLRAQAQQPGQ
jgi:hypothetical protein